LTDTDKQNSTGKYKLNTNQKKINNLKYSKTKLHKNYPGSVASYNTRPGNEVGLFYNAPEATRGCGKDTGPSKVPIFVGVILTSF